MTWGACILDGGREQQLGRLDGVVSPVMPVHAAGEAGLGGW